MLNTLMPILPIMWFMGLGNLHISFFLHYFHHERSWSWICLLCHQILHMYWQGQQNLNEQWNHSGSVVNLLAVLFLGQPYAFILFQKLMSLFSRAAGHNIGIIDWEPYIPHVSELVPRLDRHLWFHLVCCKFCELHLHGLCVIWGYLPQCCSGLTRN